MSIVIYHNPRCSKSRQTLALLKEQGLEPKVIEYLATPPQAATLKTIIRKLGISARELIRTGENDYKQSKAAVDAMSDGELVDWMVANPKVIERPIVVSPSGARIGRPPECVLEILN